MGSGRTVQRVLMTADTVGGVWTYSLDLARGLGRHGVEVVLAAMGGAMSPGQAREAAAISSLQVFESAYRLEWMPEPWVDVERAGDWLLTLENDVSPDVVHLNGYAHGDLPWRAPHLVVGHSCVLSWWRSVKGVAAPPEWGRYRSAVAGGIRGADLVVAPTRAMLSELHRYYGPLDKTAVLSNGRSRESYRSSAKQPLVLAAGRIWDEAKNISALAKVAGELEWPVYVAGESRHPAGVRSEFEHVALLGVLEASELAQWFAKAAIYCLPARYEPFGLSVLEAALSGCALVLGDIPSLRENWEGAARFVPPDDHEALSAGLREIIGNMEFRDSLAAAALKRAASFSVDCMASSYLSVYAQLVRDSIPVGAAGD